MSARLLHSAVPALVRLAVVMLCAIFIGCHERELCYDHSHVSPVYVSFDWSEAPDASPRTMVVWFFPVDGSQGRRYELLDNTRYRAAGSKNTDSPFDSQIMVPPGEYYVLCHNGSTENNMECGYSFENYTLSTSEDDLLSPLNRTQTAPRPDDTDSQPVRRPADEVWADALPEIVKVEKSAAKEIRLSFTPSQSHVTCHIKITDVRKLTPSLDISAIITGVAESYSPSSGLCAGAAVTVPFKVAHCGADCLTATVMLFGDNAPHDEKHWLRLYTSYNYYYDFDITDYIHSAAGLKDIYINLSGLTLHSPDGGGIRPGVGGWVDSEKEEIVM